MALPQRELELAEPQRAARRTRAPGLDEGAKLGATERRVQQGQPGERQQQAKSGLEQAHPQQPAQPGATTTPRRRRGARRNGFGSLVTPRRAHQRILFEGTSATLAAMGQTASGRYSHRNATIGSTLVARRAGI